MKSMKKNSGRLRFFGLFGRLGLFGRPLPTPLPRATIAPMTPATYPCPRCGRPCQPSGGLSILGAPVAVGVFGCDTCTVALNLDGADVFQGQFLFVVTATGEILDAQTFERIEVTGHN